MSLVGLLDSTHQTFEGWTMDNISATLPMVSMTAAEAEIKKHIIENQALQSCCCQPKVGRDADILLGELYQRIFPIPIHSLDDSMAEKSLNMYLLMMLQ